MNLLTTVCQGQGWHVSEVAGYAGHQSVGVVSVSMARRELRLLVMEMKFQCKYGFAVDFLNLFFFAVNLTINLVRDVVCFHRIGQMGLYRR